MNKHMQQKIITFVACRDQPVYDLSLSAASNAENNKTITFFVGSVRR